MKIQFLESSNPSLRWMKEYYKNNPQLDNKKVFENFLQTQLLLCQQPFSGNKYENFDDIRELKIPKSNFSILYTHKRNTNVVIDIRDQRGLRSSIALEEFNMKLRKKYKISIKT